MKLQIHSVHFDADVKLKQFIQKKADKLDTFFERIIDGEVFLRLENNVIDNKVLEMKLNIPRYQLFATAQAKSFEEAADMVTEKLRRQLRKHKQKLAA